MNEVKWGPIGSEVYERTYRRVKENGENEEWADTVRRVVEGNTGLVEDKYIESTERGKLFDLIYNFKAIPGGRHLWVSGVPGRQFLFNCHRAAFTNKLEDHYTFTFDELMKGGGVGANYSLRYISDIPALTSKVDIHIVCDEDHPDYAELVKAGVLSDRYSSSWDGCHRIADDREGWVEALELVLKALNSENETQTVVLDVSIIRERGARIRGFGGTASGPCALAEMLHNVARVFNEITGRAPTSLEHMTVDHYIAECVVAGNVRRSARMSIKSWKDPDILAFITCKQDAALHWSTNMSVEVDDEFFIALKKKGHKLNNHAKDVYRKVVAGMLENGEPGFYNITLASEGELGDVGSTNPCGEIALEEWENCLSGDTKIVTKEYGSVTLSSVVGKAITVPANGDWHEGEVHFFGNQPLNTVDLVPVSSSANGVFQKTRSTYVANVSVTPDHRWELVDGSITTELKEGDVVPMSASVIDESSESYEDGVRHGIIFGDGCADRQYANGDWRHRIRLFGAKADKMAEFFDHLTYPASTNGAPEAWLRNMKNLKELPDSDASIDYIGGFLYGWCLADASERPNGSLHLGSSHPLAEGWLLENAASAGYVLRGISQAPSETNFGKRKNELQFFTLSPMNESLAWRVDSITHYADDQPVYCAVVPGVEAFTLSNGIKTKNCNLGHINVGEFVDDFEGSKEAFRLMTRFLLRATFGDVPNPKQREVVDRNRRIGVGFFGFQGWLNTQGIVYSESHSNRYVRKTLRDWKAVVDKEKARYAFEMRIPTPIKGTTLAPTGTIAKLCGATEGGQTVYSPWFLRRVRYAANDPKLIGLAEQGYDIEPCIYSPNTSVVSFYVEDPLVQKVIDAGYDPEIVEGANDVSLADMLAVQSMLQECYADNAVSFTVNIEPDAQQVQNLKRQAEEGVSVYDLKIGPALDESVDEAAKVIIHYLPHLKGTTIMVDGSRPQSPLERITKADFDMAEYVKEFGQGELACSVNGCPVR